MLAYIQSNYDVFEKDLVRSDLEPVTRASLLAQYGRCEERVTEEHYMVI